MIDDPKVVYFVSIFDRRKIARCKRGFKAFVAYVQWNARTTYPINNRNILEVDRVIINIGAMMGFDRLFVRVTLGLIYIYISLEINYYSC